MISRLKFRCGLHCRKITCSFHIVASDKPWSQRGIELGQHKTAGVTASIEIANDKNPAPTIRQGYSQRRF
jgi:hypothetical protein